MKKVSHGANALMSCSAFTVSHVVAHQLGDSETQEKDEPLEKNNSQNIRSEEGLKDDPSKAIETLQLQSTQVVSQQSSMSPRVKLNNAIAVDRAINGD